MLLPFIPTSLVPTLASLRLAQATSDCLRLFSLHTRRLVRGILFLSHLLYRKKLPLSQAAPFLVTCHTVFLQQRVHQSSWTIHFPRVLYTDRGITTPCTTILLLTPVLPVNWVHRIANRRGTQTLETKAIGRSNLLQSLNNTRVATKLPLTR